MGTDHGPVAFAKLDVETADLRSFFGGHRGDAFRQLLEAVAETIDEVVVVQVFLDDDVDHRHAVGPAHGSAFSAGSAEHHYRFRPMLFFDSADVLFNDVVGVFPRGALPLVLPAVFLRALHRVDDAVGMIGEVGQWQRGSLR